MWPWGRIFAFPAGTGYDLSFPEVAAIPANMLPVASSGQRPKPHSDPTHLRHDLGQTLVGAGATTLLWDSEEIEGGLGGDALDPIIIDLTAQSLQR
jgi:hypothetical protein